jgi:hypothetical protein
MTDEHFRYDLGMQLHLVGESLMGWMAWDLMRAASATLGASTGAPSHPYRSKSAGISALRELEQRTGVKMADIEKNPCGFPIARIVVVFSMAVGTVLEAVVGKYQGKQTGENSLFRTLHDRI